MKFTTQLPHKHLDLLNLRVRICAKGCPHCGCQDSIKSHGYLKGLPYHDDDLSPRALRFFAPIAIPIKAAGAPLLSIGTIYSLTAAYALESFSNCYSR